MSNLNDFVIKGCEKTRTSKFHLEINNKEVLEIYCDLIESKIELDILEENTKIR